MPPSPLQPSSPTPRTRSRGTGKRAGNPLPPERSASFHGRTKTAVTNPADLRRHKTQPDLLSGTSGRRSNISSVTMQDLNRRKVPAKILVNVNVQRSIGALQVMASTEWTVDQLVEAAIKQYIKEGRRPLLTCTDPSNFSLHYSQFSLESLDPKEKLVGLGSRNFFLCPKSIVTYDSGSSTLINKEGRSSNTPTNLPSSSSSSCSKESEKASKLVIPWLRFMEFLF